LCGIQGKGACAAGSGDGSEEGISDDTFDESMSATHLTHDAHILPPPPNSCPPARSASLHKRSHTLLQVLRFAHLDHDDDEEDSDDADVLELEDDASSEGSDAVGATRWIPWRETPTSVQVGCTVRG
jgi:hypothetical protein